MIRVSIVKRWKGNKPAVQSESSKSSVPSTFIKRLTKKKNLKQVVYEKKKSDVILNEGEARSRDYRSVRFYSVIIEEKVVFEPKVECSKFNLNYQHYV